MTEPTTSKKNKRIAIAIAMDEPVDHHQLCCQGIMRYAENKPDWEVVIDPTLSGVRDQAGAVEYDGVVGRIETGALEDARNVGVPVVNHWINSPTRDVPTVLPDFEATGHMVAEHLIARGFRGVGYVTFPTDRSKPLTVSGLSRALDKHLLPLHELDVPFYFESNRKNYTQFINEVRDWLLALTPPVGLFIPNAAMALQVMQVCRELGLNVPNEIGVVVLYSNDLLNLTSKPTLSWVKSDNEQVGYLSAQLLDRLIAGKVTEPVPTTWVPPQTLLVRGSSDAFVSDNPVVSQAMRYIADHVQRPLRIEDVANAVHSSKRTLERHFKLSHDRTVGAEITRLRVEMLKRSLLDSNQPIGRIAEECGFGSTGHLSRYFRKEVGLSPRQYRAQRLGSQAPTKGVQAAD